MKEKIKQIIDRNTEGNYLLSDTDKAQIVSEILDLVGVTDSLLADFLKYAIDDTMRISGGHDGLAGTTFVGDTYEKIAADYNVVRQSEQLPCAHLWKSRFNEKRGSYVICSKCSEER